MILSSCPASTQGTEAFVVVQACKFQPLPDPLFNTSSSKPQGKYSVSACCAIWPTLSVVIGPLFTEQNTPLQPLCYRRLPVQLPPPFTLAPADSRGRMEVTVDSIQTVQTLPAVRVVPCSAVQYSGQ